MAIYAGFAALAVFGYLRAADAARAKAMEVGGLSAAQAFDEKSQEFTTQVLGWLGWATKEDVDAIFAAKVPLLLIFFFAAASYFLPLLVALVAFDQFSELSTRGARYALLRVRRGSYFAGKASAAAGSVAAFLLVMWIIATGVAVWHEGTEVFLPALHEGIRGWILMCVLSLPYLSITAFISSWVTPGYAFLLTLGCWIAMALGEVVVNNLIPWIFIQAGWPSAGEQERRLLALFPWHHSPNLIARSAGPLASGIGGLLILATIGYALTYLNIRRRDV
jgi:hypothetical protein